MKYNVSTEKHVNSCNYDFLVLRTGKSSLAKLRFYLKQQIRELSFLAIFFLISKLLRVYDEDQTHTVTLMGIKCNKFIISDSLSLCWRNLTVLSCFLVIF